MSGGTLPKNVEKLLSDASAKLKEARGSNDPTKAYEDAIELTKKATELSPEASEVWSAHAMALLCLCKRNEAWKAYRQSLKLVKGKSKSVKFISRSQAVEFARMYEDHGKINEAEEQLSLLTDHSPKYPGGWLELARFYLRNNRLDDAEFTLTHGLHEIEHETLYLALAEVQALCGRLDQALYRTKEALTIKPDFFEALMHVGLYGRRLDREKDEKDALAKAADLVKKHPELKEKYEDYLKIINESDAVVFWKQEFVEPEPPEVEEEEPEPEPEPKPVSKLPPKPISKLPPKPKSEPSVTVTKPEKPSTSAKSGSPEEQLRNRTEEEPENPQAWYELGEFLREVEKYVEAEKALKTAVELNPNLSDAYRSLGMLYLSTNRVEEGDRAFRRAVSLNPASSDSWLELSRHQLQKGDFSAALESINKCLRTSPNNYEGWHVLALIHLKFNNVKEAHKAAQKAVDLKISYAEGWKTLGQILDMRKKGKDALEAFRNVVEINPDDSMGWSNVGVAYIKLKRTREALGAFQKAVELDPENLIGWKNLATLHRQEGRTREAEAANQKFLELQRKKAHS